MIRDHQTLFIRTALAVALSATLSSPVWSHVVIDSNDYADWDYVADLDADDTVGGLLELKSGTVQGVYGGYGLNIAKDNTVKISGGSATNVWGGNSYHNASDNKVIMTGGSVSGNIWGGESYLDGGQNNSVSMSGGEAGWVMGVYYGSEDDAVVTGNSVSITGTATVAGVSGAEAANSTITNSSVMIDTTSSAVIEQVVGAYNDGTGHVSQNQVSVNNGRIENLYGAYTWDGNADSQSVTITGGEVTGTVFGASVGTGNVTNNQTTMSAGEVKKNLYGANTDSGDATGNKVTLKGGVVGTTQGPGQTMAPGTGDIVAAVSKNGNATGNQLMIEGGQFAIGMGGATNGGGNATQNELKMSGGESLGILMGGNAVSGTGTPGGDALKNTVSITGGLFNTVYGGYADGNANGNTVSITGGALTPNVNGAGFSIMGGQSAKGMNAVNNRVIIENDVDLQAAQIWGGRSVPTETKPQGGDVISGNTLTKNSKSKVGTVLNFETIEFTESGDANIDQLILTTNDTVSLVKLDTGANDVNFNGRLTGQYDKKDYGNGEESWQGGIEKTGAGSLTLSAANDFTGTALVSEGILRVAHQDALKTAGNVVVSDKAELNYAGAGNAYTEDALQNEGTVRVTDATLTLDGLLGVGETAQWIVDGAGKLVMATTGGNTNLGAFNVAEKAELQFTGAGNVFGYSALENNGTVHVTDASLTLDHGLTASETSRWVVDGNGRLTISQANANMNIGSAEVSDQAELRYIGTGSAFTQNSIKNEGTVRVSHATVTINGPISTNQNSKWIVDGEGKLVMAASGATMTLGVAEVGDKAELHYTGADHAYAQQTLKNEGTVHVSDATLTLDGQVETGASSRWVVDGSGKLAMTSRNAALALGSVTINDQATIELGGQGSGYGIHALQNNGTVRVTDSTLALTGALGTTENSRWIVDGTGRLMMPESGLGATGSELNLGSIEVSEKAAIYFNGEKNAYTQKTLKNEGTVVVADAKLTVKEGLTANEKSHWVLSDKARLMMSTTGGSSNLGSFDVGEKALLQFAGAENVFGVEAIKNAGLVWVNDATLTVDKNLTATADSRWMVDGQGKLVMATTGGSTNVGGFDVSGGELQFTGKDNTFGTSSIMNNGTVRVTDATVTFDQGVTAFEASRWVVEGEGKLAIQMPIVAVNLGTVEVAEKAAFDLSLTAATFAGGANAPTLTSLTNAGSAKLTGGTINVGKLSNQGSLALSHATVTASGIQSSSSSSVVLDNASLAFETKGTAPATGSHTLGAVESIGQSSLTFDVTGEHQYDIASVSGENLTIGVNSLKKSAVTIGQKADETKVTVKVESSLGNDFANVEDFAQAAADTVTQKGDGTAGTPSVADKIVADKVTGDEGDVHGDFEVNVNNGTVVTQKNRKIESYQFVQSLSSFLWRHETNDLVKRMGELRDAPQGVGAWARVFGSEQEMSGIKAKNTSLQVGFDTDVAKGWKAGAAFTYTDGKSDMANGSADNEALGLATYGAWFGETGAFVDVIGRYSHIKNDFTIDVMTGDYSTNAVALSAEAGWRVNVTKSFFMEPQAELTWGRVEGKTFTTGNGVTLAQDDVNSTIARLGVRAGYDFPQNRGNVYLRASVLHDFEGDMRTVATKDRARDVSDADLGGSWGEFGIGANWHIRPNASAYFDFERTTGGEVEENWRWNVGYRYTF